MLIDQSFFDHLWTDLTTPGSLVGHLAYVLLVLSMLMRSMLWLRLIALASGVASVAYGWVWLGDPLVVMWEALFTLTNLAQLAIMLYEQRRSAFSDDQQAFVDAVMPDADMGQVRRLMALGRAGVAEPNTVLFRRGEVPRQLLVITRGTAQVERDGAVIGACGEGDFLGEISFQQGGPATADVVVTNTLHFMAFDQAALRTFLKRNEQIGHTLNAAMNRNLMAKLDRTSHAASGGSQAAAAAPACD